MTSSRSDSVVSSRAGDSASGGRKGGVRAMIARSSVPARRARVSAGVVPSRSVTFSAARAASDGQRLGHEPRGGGRERAESYRPGRELLAGQLAQRGVELVEDPHGAGQQARARWSQGDAVPAAVKQPPAGDGLERRHLARHRRLRVAEGLGGGRERAGLRDLAQDPQAGGRDVRGHASYAWYLCDILACSMPGPRLD